VGGDVAVTDWILLELMTGLRATERTDSLLRWFAPVPSLPFDPAWWPVAWDNAARLRRRGISVTAADCLIATVAVQHRVPLVHCDADFERMRPTLPLETVDWTEYVTA
jgi:predicted nucleic acid-binding protein